MLGPKEPIIVFKDQVFIIVAWGLIESGQVKWLGFAFAKYNQEQNYIYQITLLNKNLKENLRKRAF